MLIAAPPELTTPAKAFPAHEPRINTFALFLAQSGFTGVSDGYDTQGPTRMLRTLAEHLSLERRRLTFVVTLAFLAGVLFYGHIPTQAGSLPAPILAGALYAGLIGPAALMTCIFLPAARFLIEGIALSRLVVALTAFNFPEVGSVLLASPLLMTTIIVAGGSLVSRSLHGRIERSGGFSIKSWFDRKQVRIRAKTWQLAYVAWMDLRAPIRA